jgi:hypothetical protein
MSSLILRAFALVLTFALWSGTIMAQGLPVQTSSQSAVTVKVTPLNLSEAGWDFQVVFDTHTQELNDDLLKRAVLIANGSRVSPTAWKGDAPGGHHREGVLSFDPLTPRPGAFELQIDRPGEAKPRSFKWTLK